MTKKDGELQHVVAADNASTKIMGPEFGFFDRPVGGALWMLCLQATAPPAGAVSSEASFVLKNENRGLVYPGNFSEWRW